jgi:uncharacterized protein (TIGR00730 family)
MKRVCVFMGSSMGNNPEYAETASEVAKEIARRKMELVYGGSHAGLMGTVADAALAVGGKVIGVIPQALVDKEIAHTGLTTLHVVGSMHERKARMAELSHGFIALPGGFGTLEEFCEILTWAQLGFHRKPFGMLNTYGYYDGLLNFFDHAVSQGFLKSEHRELVLVETDPVILIDKMLAYQPTFTPKWVTREEL